MFNINMIVCQQIFKLIMSLLLWLLYFSCFSRVVEVLDAGQFLVSELSVVLMI